LGRSVEGGIEEMKVFNFILSMIAVTVFGLMVRGGVLGGLMYLLRIMGIE